MRSADLPGLRRFNGGCGSFRLRFRQRRQLSLDLRYLWLRIRNQAFASALCLQLSSIAFGCNISAWRDIAFRPARARALAKALERTSRNRVPDVLHQALVIGDI